MAADFVIEPLSVCNLLANAIHEYCGEHYGDFPNQIELHPNLFAAFITEVKPQHCVCNQDGNTRWHGVTILQVWDAQYPRMIGHKGDVVFL